MISWREERCAMENVSRDTAIRVPLLAMIVIPALTFLPRAAEGVLPLTDARRKEKRDKASGRQDTEYHKACMEALKK